MNKGFSSVYVVICLSALVFLLLCVCELCEGYAAGSMAENVCLSAGGSVLSEYQPELQKRYGIFALSSYEQKLSALNSFYIRHCLNGTQLLVRPQLRECAVSTEGLEGLKTDVLAKQIDALGVMLTAKDGLELAGAADLLRSLLDPVNKREDEEASEELKDVPSPPEGTSGKSAAELKKEYDEAMDPDFGLEEGRSLVSVHKDELPRALLGMRPSSSLLGYAASALLQDGLSPSSLLQARYTIEVCSDLIKRRSDTILGLETEYVLFGKGSDRENEKEMKTALFKVRTAIDLARNLRDEAKMSAYAAAAAACPAIPQPLAILIIAAIDAAVQAKGEVSVLCGGGCVEIVRGAQIGSRRFGTYRDYALLLLMILPEQTRLARLMDIMQVNAAYMDGASFAFRDYCYGFTLSAQFEKRSILPQVSGSSREGTVVQIHAYR
ncbi:MAG: hypothetical protein J6X24_06280 [Firmicutes bacterium]|nr:hypothetical protein [Bacillota bacterium]